jgi:hypothetical protein
MKQQIQSHTSLYRLDASQVTALRSVIWTIIDRETDFLCRPATYDFMVANRRTGQRRCLTAACSVFDALLAAASL